MESGTLRALFVDRERKGTVRRAKAGSRPTNFLLYAYLRNAKETQNPYARQSWQDLGEDEKFRNYSMKRIDNL